jgi:hypothetical protein
LSDVKLSVIILNMAKGSDIMMSVTFQSAVMPRVVMLLYTDCLMLSVIMPSVIMLSINMLNVQYPECRYAVVFCVSLCLVSFC